MSDTLNPATWADLEAQIENKFRGKKNKLRLTVPEGIKAPTTSAEYQDFINGKAIPETKKSVAGNDLMLIGIKYNFAYKKYIEVIPTPAPRQTQSDKWKPRDCVIRYRNFCDSFKLICNTMGYALEPVFKACFVIPMSASWSEAKKERMLYQYHTQKPDIDNLTKSCLDAFRIDDGFVCELRVLKIWGLKGAIILF